MEGKKKKSKKDVSTFSDLKLPVHLLQIRHGVTEVCLQGGAALVCLPLGLPEHSHLLLQTQGGNLLRLTPRIPTDKQ